MRNIFHLLLIFSSCAVALAQSNSSISNLADITGSYALSNGYVGSAYNFTADGEYESETFSDCCDPVWKETGTYELKENGKLHLKIIKKTLEQYNMLDPKEAAEAYRKLYHRESEVKAEDIKTEYEMQIVKWSERRYLLEPDDITRFIAAVNLGIEPRRSIIANTNLSSSYFLRSGDEKKPVKGKPLLPPEWSSHILSTPVLATVTKIEFNDKENIYVVNRGSADGLKIGMCLIGTRIRPDWEDSYSIWNSLLWIESVDEHSAKLKSKSISKTRIYKTGNRLSTNYIKRTR